MPQKRPFNKSLLVGGLIVLTFGLFFIKTAEAVILPPEPTILLDLKASFTEGTPSGVFGWTFATGYASTSERIALQYTPTENQNVCQIKTRLYTRVDSPGYEARTNLIFSIYYGGFLPEEGIELYSTEIASTTIYNWSLAQQWPNVGRFLIPLSNCVSFSANNNYFFVFEKKPPLSTPIFQTDAYYIFLNKSTTTIEGLTATSTDVWRKKVEDAFWSRYAVYGHPDYYYTQLDIELSGETILYPYTSYSPTLSSTTLQLPPASTTLGFWGNLFTDVFGSLFIPSQDIWIYFTGLWDTIKSKAPIGYLALSISALSGLSTSTPAFAMPDLSALSVIFNPLKNIIIMALWILFVIWTFHRLRKLEL